MNNPIHVARLFRADRLRREAVRQVVVKPAVQRDASNDAPDDEPEFDRDAVVFLVCAVLGYVAFVLALLGVI
jgi:hypothetical protein